MIKLLRNKHGRYHIVQWYMDYLQYNWPAIFYQDPPFWVMPDTYIKYWFLKLLRRKPIWNWDAEEIFDDYVQGEGVYMSDGVYVSLSTWAIMQGFTPMWKSDGRGL